MPVFGAHSLVLYGVLVFKQPVCMQGFRKYARIRETLVHELTHNVWGDHDNNFKTLNSQLLRQCIRMNQAHILQGDPVRTLPHPSPLLRQRHRDATSLSPMLLVMPPLLVVFLRVQPRNVIAGCCPVHKLPMRAQPVVN